MTGGREDVIRALAEHRWSAPKGQCKCRLPFETRDEHDSHLASVLASLSDERLAQAEAKALEDFADEWDEDTEENKTRLGDMASEHYHAGGPSMPAIAARLKAASIRAALSGDAAPRADGDTR